MRSIFGMEISSAGQYAIAFIVIFGLLALFALVLRKVTGGRKISAQGATRARQPRLGIVDIYDLDRQRQLLLLRRDNVEHLVMIGGPNDVVVETSISRSQSGRAPNLNEVADEPAERRPEPPARPSVDVPAAARAAERPAEPRPRAREPRETAREPAREPVRETARDATSMTARMAEPARVDPSSRSGAKAGEDSRLSDMTRQLEEALKKPFSAVRPATGAAGSVEPLTTPPAGRPGQDASPAAPRPSAPVPLPTRPERPDRSDRPERSDRAPSSLASTFGLESSRRNAPEAPKPDPASSPGPPGPPARPRNAPPPEAAKPEPAAEKPPPQPAAADKPKELDPFSPEAIEAEFARLLGRSTTKSDT